MKKMLRRKSHRVPAKTRYRVIKQVREHNRKLRRAARANPIKNKKPKPIDVPDECPFKASILEEADAYKQRMVEEKEKLSARLEELQKEEEMGGEAMKLEEDLKMGTGITVNDFVGSAEARNTLFENLTLPPNTRVSIVSYAPKPCYREFRKVIEAADVILEVLDARDPLGTRCPQVERAVLDYGPSKRLVLVLNKADLVPQDNLHAWLAYLRRSFPTVPFKASTQSQRRNIGHRRRRLVRCPQNLIKSSPCMGADLLMSVLANYCRNKGIKTSIQVGVVGLPNVGKSSIINSLKRKKACNTGAVPGVTRLMQVVQLDSKIKLLDSPGVVLSSGSETDASVALKNALNVHTMEDPITPATAILQRANKEQIMMLYNVADYSTPTEFLAMKSRKMGKLHRGGVPDLRTAAKSLIMDWNSGKIKYFTVPPEEDEHEVHISASIVKEMAAEFDVNSIEQMEMAVLKSLQPVLPGDTMQLPSAGPVEVLQEDGLEKMVVDTGNIAKNGSKLIPRNVRVNIEKKKPKSEVEERKKDPESLLEGNQMINKMRKLQMKKMKKQSARREKQSSLLAGVLESVCISTAEDYDFNVDFDPAGSEDMAGERV